jgi:hypothetical protein
VYHAAVAAAEKEEKMRVAQSRKPRDRSVPLPPPSNQPIRIKEQDRTRLPTPKNLVLLSLMEATIGTLAASNSLDLTEQMENTSNIISSTASTTEAFEGKRIMAGVNIVTGGCGTYAVTSKNGVTVYPWKTTKAEEASTITQKENDIPDDTKPQSLTITPTHPQSLDHIFYAVTRLPVSNSIHPILKSWSSSSSDPLPKPQDKALYSPTNGGLDNSSRANTTANSNYSFARRSTFRLKFADRVQVVEMESDGWAKLARGNGYILAEHGQGSDLVKGE